MEGIFPHSNPGTPTKKALFSVENSAFSLFFSLKNVVKIDTFDLTTEIPQTDFYFDHRKGRPFQGVHL